MKEFFSEFSASSEQEWVEQLKTDLKGQDINHVLRFKDEVEDIDLPSYSHADSAAQANEKPGDFPFKRGYSQTNNHWDICVEVPFSENAKQMNQFALNALMSGAENIQIQLGTHSLEGVKQVIEGIQFNYICATLYYTNSEQFDYLMNALGNVKPEQLSLIRTSKDLPFSNKHRHVLIDAHQIHSVGGNAIQEIAFALFEGHNQLLELMSTAANPQHAIKQIKFRFGIGANYFVEIAKFRVFRVLWSTIVAAYIPEGDAMPCAYIEARSGNVNKSIADPNTNLLRLTTEAMSAVIGGVNELTLLPYNIRQKDADIEKSQRLAINISLILKEEAFLTHVIDPSGGAYNLEDLTEQLSEKAWQVFLSLEKNQLEEFKSAIQTTARKRIELIENKTNTLIGINKYFNPDKLNHEWETAYSTPFGDELILARDTKKIVA